MADYGSVPFDEQISFFRSKVNLPTKDWTEIWQSAHDRAFVVAGAIKADLVQDFRQAVGKAIEQGTTIEAFRKDFDAIVKKHGWSYKGGRGWRSRVIWATNIRTAHMAGRYQQMQKAKKRRPYWQYKHADYVTNPRLDHKAWDGLILKADDPWWQTHYPPNGWGCKCRVNALSESDLIKMGKIAPDKAPDLDLQTVTVGTRGDTPRAVEVPKGIDPGWAYAPGRTWFPNLENYPFEMAYSIVQDYVKDGVMQRWFEKIEAKTKILLAQEPYKNLKGDELIKEIRKSGMVSNEKLPMAIIDPETKNMLKAQTQVVFISEDTLIKQIIKREKQQYSSNRYTNLNATLSGVVVKKEGNNKIIYFSKDQAYWLTVIKITKDKKELYLVSERKVSPRELKKKLSNDELKILGVA